MRGSRYEAEDGLGTNELRAQLQHSVMAHAARISKRTSPRQGNHNYIADVALGFQDASAEVAFPVDITILGYTLAQKYDTAREYCRHARP